jgi:hypothetical protein
VDSAAAGDYFGLGSLAVVVVGAVAGEAAVACSLLHKEFYH